MAALSRVVSAFLAICALSADTLAQTAEPASQTISDQTFRITQAVPGATSSQIGRYARRFDLTGLFLLETFGRKNPMRGSPQPRQQKIRILSTGHKICCGELSGIQSHTDLSQLNCAGT